jgi:hypothetical protein
LGKAGDSFKNIAEKKGFAVGVMQEREKAEFGKGGKGDRRHINTDRFRRGKKSTTVVVDYVDGGHERVGGDNGGRAAVFVPTSYPTSILSPPVVHLTLLFLSLCTSSHFSFTTRLR